MRDKRKIFFCLICLIIIIVSERFLFIKAKKEDNEYKEMMKANLKTLQTELEIRNFKSSKDYTKGSLEYERNEDQYDYGYIEARYNIYGEITNLSVVLDYSADLYIDDIFYDAYHIFDLLGLGITNEYNLDTDLADNFLINDEFYLNNKRYNLSITKPEGKKIQFEISGD